MSSSTPTTSTHVPLSSEFCRLFTNTWALEKTESESMEEILKALGVPWLVRKAAAAGTPVLTITVTPSRLSVVQNGMMKLENSYPWNDPANTQHHTPMGIHKALLTSQQQEDAIETVTLHIEMDGKGTMEAVYQKPEEVTTPGGKQSKLKLVVVMTFTTTAKDGGTAQQQHRAKRVFYSK